MSLVQNSSDSGVATLLLARPDARNALSIDMCKDIVGALREIEADRANRVVILGGAGKSFCAGADFAAVAGPGGLDFLPAFEEMLEAVANFRLPVIARIQGAALGGGFQLATCCDFRVVAEDAALGIPSARLGIVINLENVQRLVALAGVPTAKEILMTGETISPREAFGKGIVSRVCPAPELDTVTRDLARKIAALAPLSVQGAKRAITTVAGAATNLRSHTPAAAAEVDRLVGEAYRSSDLQEGIRAMTEKRAADFRGE